MSFANIILHRLGPGPLTQVCAAKQHSWAHLLDHASAFRPWALSSVRLSQWAVKRSAIYMFLHIYSIKIIARESKFVIKQLCDKSFTIHSSHIYTKNVAFIAIRQKRHLNLEESWERRSFINQHWLIPLFCTSLLVRLRNPLQTEFPIIIKRLNKKLSCPRGQTV